MLVSSRLASCLSATLLPLSHPRNGRDTAAQYPAIQDGRFGIGAGSEPVPLQRGQGAGARPVSAGLRFRYRAAIQRGQGVACGEPSATIARTTFVSLAGLRGNYAGRVVALHGKRVGQGLHQV